MFFVKIQMQKPWRKKNNEMLKTLQIKLKDVGQILEIQKRWRRRGRDGGRGQRIWSARHIRGSCLCIHWMYCVHLYIYIYIFLQLAHIFMCHRCVHILWIWPVVEGGCVSNLPKWLDHWGQEKSIAVDSWASQQVSDWRKRHWGWRIGFKHNKVWKCEAASLEFVRVAWLPCTLAEKA